MDESKRPMPPVNEKGEVMFTEEYRAANQRYVNESNVRNFQDLNAAQTPADVLKALTKIFGDEPTELGGARLSDTRLASIRTELLGNIKRDLGKFGITVV